METEFILIAGSYVAVGHIIRVEDNSNSLKVHLSGGEMIEVNTQAGASVRALLERKTLK